MKTICSSLIKISERVSKALSSKEPIVALQSTIISHGMPYPQNKKCALSIEKTIIDNGAVPATIAIFDGKFHIGLEHSHIEKLASAGLSAKKVSRRDLPIVLANKDIGATTVSATMIGAYAAGINMFVTGGVGGVHRGYEHTLDASADLQELGKTPVSVVSAGVKSILDIAKTLEYLQTKGVPVITYGSKYFPAFFSSSSGINSPFTAQSPTQIAEFINQQHKLGFQNGMLIAVPNDKPQQGQFIENAIQKALKEANEKSIKGADITPFLLSRVNDLTQGKSLASNISLVHNNAKIGAKIAVQLNRLQKQPQYGFSTAKERKIIVIGASAVDYRMMSTTGKFELHKSCPVRSFKTLGGVARNIAEVCTKLNTKTTFITILGNDDDGNFVKEAFSKNDIDLHLVKNDKNLPTSRYFSLIEKSSNQFMGISEMHINNELSFDGVYETYFKNAQINPDDIIITQAGIDERSMCKLVQFLAQKGYFIYFEAKGQKSRRVIETKTYEWIDVLKMNNLQKMQIDSVLKEDHNEINQWFSKSIGKKTKNKQLADIKAIITNGSNNLEIVPSDNNVKYMKVVKSDKVKNTIGAGDTFSGTFCSMLLKGKSVEQALKYGIVASKFNIEQQVKPFGSVISEELNLSRLQQLFKTG